MQQLDLFNKEPEKKKDTAKHPLKPPVRILVDEPEKNTTTEEKKFIQLIKPLSKNTDQPVKRGRKSLKDINLDVLEAAIRYGIGNSLQG